METYVQLEIIETEEVEETREDNIVLAGYTDTAGSAIGLIIGIGVAVLVLIFVGVIGGQTYQTAESSIQEINNTAVRDHIADAIVNGFKALGLTGKYLPLLVLAAMIGIVLTVLLYVFRPAERYGGVL